jgi:hypothetical protein
MIYLTSYIGPGTASLKNPRDKVLALHGLFPKRVQKAIPVDYNMSVERLFTNVAVYLIMSKRSLEVLKHVSWQWQPLDLDRVASWVPDWSLGSHTPMLPAQFTPAQMRDILEAPIKSRNVDCPTEDPQKHEELPGDDSNTRLFPHDYGWDVCDRSSSSTC